MGKMHRYAKHLSIALLLGLLFVSTAFASTENVKDIFTVEEKNWITSHPEIIVAPDPAFAPIEFYENGEFVGISIDYLKEVTRRYGLKFKFVRYETWNDILEAAKKREIDVITAAAVTEPRRAYLDFTTAYLTMPNQFFIRNGTPPIGQPENLKTRKVAVINGYSSEDYLKLVFPEVSIIRVKDIEEALTQLSLGNIDVFVGDSGQVSYYAEYYHINNLSLDSSVTLDYPLKLSMAITKDQPTLVSIMDKVIKDFPQSDFDKIKSNWLSFKIIDSNKEKQNRLLFLGIGVLMSSVVLVIITWNRTLRKTVANQTERLRESLEESQTYQKQLRELLDLIPYPVFSKSHDQHFVTVNETYAAFFGLSPNAIEGKHDMDIYKQNPNTPLNKFRILEDVVLGEGKGAHIKEYSLTDTQGNEHIFDIKKIPFPILNQSELGLLGISVDITELKRKENERIVALSRLVSNVAHQINTPLGNVISASSFMALRKDELQNLLETNTLKVKDLTQFLETVNDVNQVMKAGLNRMVTIVSAFKSLSISAEDLNPTVFNLRDLIKDVVIEQSSFRTIDWEAHFDDALTVRTHRSVLEQILNQIVNNAVEHGFNASSLQREKIDFHFKANGDYAILKICDNGVGIPEEELAHVADPLYSSAQYYGHLGLGLSIATNMAQQLLDGHLELNNRPEGGLEVTLSFKNQ